MAEGGTLAKIDSQAEQTVVFGLVSGSSAPAWIGLTDLNEEGTFEYGDGTAFGGYTNWVNNQPDNGAAQAGGLDQVKIDIN